MKILKNITTAIFAVILFASAASAQRVQTAISETDFTVKYVGIEENYLCFVVGVDNMLGKAAYLKIDDKVDGELFAETLKPTAQMIKFKIEKKAGQVINFKLSSGKKSYLKTFSASTILSEQTIVKENTVAAL
jgi:hypothetical protein